MERWVLKDEIIKALNQWYLILAFILTGALAGFIFSYIKPAPYQATADMYIGIDINRVNELEYIIPLAEEEPLNLDDYKNWQLKQVADILTSSSVLNNTLKNLREQDSFWEEYDLEDFQKAIDIYWYDTGVWRLRMAHPQKDYAIAGVETWLETGHQKISELLSYSREQNNLDHQIWTINLSLRDLKTQRAEITTFNDGIEAWLDVLEVQDPNESLTQDDYNELADWILVYGDGSSYWENLLEGFPEYDQPADAVLAWLEEARTLSDMALKELESQTEILNSERQELLPDYHEYLEDSLGLSVNLVLQPDTGITEVHRVYNSETFIVGGAFLGLMAWLILAIARIKSVEEKHG